MGAKCQQFHNNAAQIKCVNDAGHKQLEWE